MKVILNSFAMAFMLSSTVGQPVFLSFDVEPAPQIEWDQAPYTYYTGQTIRTNWTASNMLSTDTASITYQGAGGTRTLSTGSGVSIGENGSYAVRISDSANGIATSVPITITTTRTPSVSRASSQMVSVVQSRLLNIIPLDGNRTLGGGQNTVCDDRNLTVRWRGLGEAQFGVATVSLSKVSGSPGTLGTTQTNVPVSGNTSVTIFCPRTSTPSTFSQYAFQISVQEPGGSAYTGTSASFSVVVAPTPTPTGTPTPSQTPSGTASPSPSKTPTPSPSPSRTPTPSVSVSSTPTPSQTPTVSPTPSTSETARPSIDYIAIGRAAADQVDTTTPAVAGAVGGIGGILLLLGAVKWYREKVLTQRRKQKQAMTSRFVHQANALYGVQSSTEDDPYPMTQPSVVMYSVQGLPPRGQPDPSRLATYKKAFPPKQSTF